MKKTMTGLVFSSLFWMSLAASAQEASRSECDLWEDPQGISHLRAQTDLGAYGCWGYLHGRDRAWQMDFFRRTLQGRRAEVLGSQSIRADFLMRLLKLYPRAEAIFQDLPLAQKEILQAYAHGVNRGFAAAMEKGVYEFQHWGYQPETWMPADSIAVILLQAFDQTRQAFQSSFEEYQNLLLYGEAAPELFSSDGLPWDQAILKPGEFPAAKTLKTAARQPAPLPATSIMDSHDSQLWEATRKAIEEVPDLVSKTEVGSNNWVIAPTQSRSHHAWLANDPHLELKHPPMWHWSHIQAPGFDAIGAALPGVPLIVSGTNRHLSWGLTNSYLDVGDLTLIPLTDLTGTHQPVSERPLIWFKLWKFQIPFFFKTAERILGNHPLLPLKGPKEKAIALSWTGFNLTAADFSGFFELMHASSVKEADQALSRIGVPSWNFVFADTSGNTGYRAVGRVPRRENPRPYGMKMESLAEFTQRTEAEQMLSTEEMPHLLNPARGWISTANNRQWPPQARFFTGRAHRQGFRQFRIEELLNQSSAHDFESLSRTQCDIQSGEARFILPVFLKNTPPSPTTRKALETLRSWDFQATLECEACALFRRWIDLTETESGLNQPGLYRILQNPNHPLGVKLAATLQVTLAQAILDVRIPEKSTPENPVFPKWGEVHSTYFVHMGDRGFFQDRGIATPGDRYSISPGTSEWEHGLFRHIAGASQRLIVEMSDPPTVYSILPGMNADSTKRDFNQTDSPWKKWAACEFEKRIYPLNWSTVKAKKLSL